MTTRDRVLTAPLLVCLLMVAAVVGCAVLTRHPTPPLGGAIEMLADGDLDHDERERMLQRTLELASEADTPRALWAGLLAAIALQDRERYAAFDARLDRRVPLAPEQLRFLDLGDPLLANVLAAGMAQAAGDSDRAALRWRQVAAQARMTGNSFAAELADR
ncbi:MAG TPA: hypothetical protein ENI87_13540 [bacterium]|nr:hypothetical protein [bacterium]